MQKIAYESPNAMQNTLNDQGSLCDQDFKDVFVTYSKYQQKSCCIFLI